MITSEKIIQKTQDFIKEQLQDDCTGHDWWHIERVYKLAMLIAEKENANKLVVQLAALLHDVGDWKFHEGDEVGPAKARVWLERFSLDLSTIEHVCKIISEVSFKGAGVNTKPSSLEGMIVQDADRLDALGAIGIARTFAYGGHKARPIYDPAINSQKHATFTEYKSANGTTINHFYEKLLLLKDRMNTAEGKKMAAKKHALMEAYLTTFFMEWNCEV